MIRDKLNSIIATGCKDSFDFKLNEMIKVTNSNGLIFALADVFYAVIFYYLFNNAYIFFVFIVSSISFMLVSIGFNSLGMINQSRPAVPATGALLVTTVSFFLGKESQIHFILLTNAIFPFLTFRPQEKKLICFTVAIPLLCLAFLMYFNFNLGPKYEVKSRAVEQLFVIN